MKGLGGGDVGKEKKETSVTASRDTRGKGKIKEEFGVATKVVEGKIVANNDNNTFVAAKVSGYAGFSTPLGRWTGNRTRRHLPQVLGTREGVGGQAEGTRRGELVGSRVGVESADTHQYQNNFGLTRSNDKIGRKYYPSE